MTTRNALAQLLFHVSTLTPLYVAELSKEHALEAGERLRLERASYAVFKTGDRYLMLSTWRPCAEAVTLTGGEAAAQLLEQWFAKAERSGGKVMLRGLWQTMAAEEPATAG
jgi:hypothetical protein